MPIALAAAAAVLAITVSPAAPAPDGQFHVRVTGVDAPAASVVVHGGIASAGRPFGLVPLLPAGPGAWSTILRAPGFPGVYPIRVRFGGVYHETTTVLSVLPRGFATAPSAATPAGVVEAWREASPGGATIEAATTWRQGFYSHRDQRYNRLLRVRFVLLQDWPRWHLRAGTSTRWFDVARRSQVEPWRLVGLVEAP
jgi:hypothetical protein